MTDISQDAFVKNGMDILRAVPELYTEQLLSSTVGYACTAIVDWLNNNGHPDAAQALDDQWHSRDEQWWREPDGFDGYYKNGDEKRKEIFGDESSEF